MRDKYPNVPTLLSDARRALNAAEEIERSVAEYKAEYDEAVSRLLKARSEANEAYELVGRLIQHNGFRPIADGMTLWTGPTQGCNVVRRLDANTVEMLELPPDLAEESAFKVGKWYVIDHPDAKGTQGVQGKLERIYTSGCCYLSNGSGGYFPQLEWLKPLPAKEAADGVQG